MIVLSKCGISMNVEYDIAVWMEVMRNGSNSCHPSKGLSQ